MADRRISSVSLYRRLPISGARLGVYSVCILHCVMRGHGAVEQVISLVHKFDSSDVTDDKALPHLLRKPYVSAP